MNEDLKEISNENLIRLLQNTMGSKMPGEDRAGEIMKEILRRLNEVKPDRSEAREVVT